MKGISSRIPRALTVVRHGGRVRPLRAISSTSCVHPYSATQPVQSHNYYRYSSSRNARSVVRDASDSRWFSSSTSSSDKSDTDTSVLDGAIRHGDKNPWSGVSEPKLMEETKRLCAHLQQQQQHDDRSSTTRAIVRLDDYFHVLEAWMEHAMTSKSLQAAMRAEELLEQMLTHSGVLAPTRSFFEVVLQAYAVCDGGVTAAERAHRILQFLEQQSPHVYPTTKTYNIVLNAWSKSKASEAGFHADQILSTMSPSSQPNERTIVTVMDAWNKSGHAKRSQRVLELLEETLKPWRSPAAEEENDSQNSDEDKGNTTTLQQQRPIIPLDISMFHVAMDTVVKAAPVKRVSRQQQGSNDTMTPRQAAEFAEGVLQSILQHSAEWNNVQPTVRTYSIVLDAWARVELVEQRGNAAHRAQRILNAMVNSYYTHANGSVKPNAVSFTAVITAWARAKQAQKAHDTFQRLLDLFQQQHQQHQQQQHDNDKQEDDSFLPTIVAGNAVMVAWAKERRPDFILQVMATMQQLYQQTGRTECLPDLQSYNILLDAHGKLGQVTQAVALLQWMQNGEKHLHANWVRPVGAAPDLVSYNNVMGALAKQGDAIQAEALLEHMKQQRHIHPDQVTYTSLLIAHAKSRQPDRLEQAERVWKEIAVQAAPDVICRTAFIQACAHVDRAERKRALTTALQVFADLPNDKRNHVIFAIMAKAINRLLVWHDDDDDKDGSDSQWQTRDSVHKSRLELLKELCEQCCQGGNLSHNVHLELNQVRWDSQDVVLAWLGSKSFDPKWSRNVPARSQPKPLLHATKTGRRMGSNQ
ncbi:Pentatricopeptide repeat-containing protein [Seminavis robusta]|uniref:Pentatricopeptide repeat-containing protein n=1 Tax=Seminavis robusta TaxID=568900 RepID=A0A9N8ED79_9STRA|nr:Pentatricopeptide repeat-containing protein [Seminavis robusta]|eukprot:Sro920_g220190.1 Pentatricopeptide repeat-containing protein (809) ;mRNA; f:8182-10608